MCTTSLQELKSFKNYINCLLWQILTKKIFSFSAFLLQAFFFPLGLLLASEPKEPNSSSNASEVDVFRPEKLSLKIIPLFNFLITYVDLLFTFRLLPEKCLACVQFPLKDKGLNTTALRPLMSISILLFSADTQLCFYNRGAFLDHFRFEKSYLDIIYKKIIAVWLLNSFSPTILSFYWFTFSRLLWWFSWIWCRPKLLLLKQLLLYLPFYSRNTLIHSTRKTRKNGPNDPARKSPNHPTNNTRDKRPKKSPNEAASKTLLNSRIKTKLLLKPIENWKPRGKKKKYGRKFRERLQRKKVEEEEELKKLANKSRP